LKESIIVLFLLLFITTVAYGLFSYTSQLCKELDDILIQLNQEISEENWSAASHKVSKLQNQWEQADVFWSTYIDHKEIDLVDESIARLSVLVQIKSQDDLLVEIGQTRRLLQRVKENETPEFHNVF